MSYSKYPGCALKAVEALDEDGPDYWSIPPMVKFDKAVVVYGPSKSNKFPFAHSHFQLPFIVEKVSDLRFFPQRIFDAIIFREVDFTRHGFNFLYSLLQVSTKVALTFDVNDVIYGPIYIPAGLPRVFISRTADVFGHRCPHRGSGLSMVESTILKSCCNMLKINGRIEMRPLVPNYSLDTDSDSSASEEMDKVISIKSEKLASDVFNKEVENKD